MGLTYNSFWSDLTFEGSRNASIARQAVLVTSELQVGRRATVQIGAGGVAQGSLEIGGLKYRIGPGMLGAAALSYRVLDATGAAPFVLLSASFGASAARTTLEGGGEQGQKLVALDARIGGTAGWTFAGVVSPYVSARLFGGPVSWTLDKKSIVGTDQYHYQPAIGAVLSLEPIDLFAEWAFAGERSITAGAGLSF